jgi:MFS family permease
MFAMLSTAWILPGVFGPAIAGFVAQDLHWRLVFLGLLPLIALPGAMATRALIALHEAQSTTGVQSGTLLRRTLDGLAVAGGVALITAGLTNEDPVLMAVLATVGVVITVAWFRRLTPPGTLRLARGYPTAIVLRGVLTFAFFCVDAYVALLLVEVRGWSASAAGVALTAATVSWTAGSWIQARLSTRFSPEEFARVGFPIVALGIALLGLVLVPDVPAILAVPTFAVAGLGMGLAYSQFALIVLRDVPPAEQGSVTSALTLSDTVGTALGLGVSAAIVAATIRAGEGPGPGIGGAVLLGVAVAIVGSLLSPRLRVRRAEALG